MAQKRCRDTEGPVNHVLVEKWSRDLLKFNDELSAYLLFHKWVSTEPNLG